MSFALRSRAFAALLAVIALLASTNLALGNSGKSASREIDSQNGAANFLDEASRASLEYAASRVAPGTEVPAGAFAAARQQATALATTRGSWSEITNQPYDSDSTAYRDPVFSNSGGGSGLVTGRMTA